MNDRYNFLKVHGICVQCGQRDAAQGYVRCPECIEKLTVASAKCWEDEGKRKKYNERGKQRIKELREQRKKESLCIACGKQVKSGIYCDWCKNKRNARRRIGRSQGELFRDRIEAGVCMYCGKRVVPGYKFCEIHLKTRQECIKRIQYKASEKWRKEINGEWKTRQSKNSVNG